METLILVASPIAIAALVAVNALMGGWRRARVATLEEAAAALQADFLTFDAGEGVVSADERAALVVDCSRDAIGLVTARGDRLVTRLLTRGGAFEVVTAEPDALVVRLNDFTFPRARLILSDPDTAQRWADALNRLRDDKHREPLSHA